MSQRHVEILLGRLLTDEKLRRRFFPIGPASFETVSGERLELTTIERHALASLDAGLCERFAASLDARLKKAAILSDDSPSGSLESGSDPRRAGDAASQTTAPRAEGGSR
jgi:hypothetical protein